MKQDISDYSSRIPSSKQKVRLGRKALRRALVIMVVLCLMVGATKWTGPDFLFRFQGGLPEEHPGGLTYQEVQETVEQLTIQPVLPNWYPKGTVLEHMEIYDTLDGTYVDIAFTVEEMEFFLGVQVFQSAPIGTKNYEKDPGPVEIYYIEEIPHHIFTNMGDIVVVWKNGNTENSLRGNAFQTEDIAIAKRMIDSIYH